MIDDPDDILRNKRKQARVAGLHRRLDAVLDQLSGRGRKAKNPDEEIDSSGTGDAAGEGESAMGSMIGGAVSKSDGDGRMTKKKENRIMRAASVTVRSMADKGDALTKAMGGNFNTIESDLRRMSGADLNNYISSNPTLMDKTGTTWVQKEMNQSGYKKQLDVLSHGTLEAAQRDVKRDVMNALLSKPLSDMTPDEVRFVQDKLSELGVLSGKSDGDIHNPRLQAALGGLIADSPAMQEMEKQGRIMLGTGGSPDASPMKNSFVNAASGMEKPEAPGISAEILPRPGNPLAPGKRR